MRELDSVRKNIDLSYYQIGRYNIENHHACIAMRILILDKWIGTNFDITTSSCNTVSTIMALGCLHFHFWSAVVCPTCGQISAQKRFGTYNQSHEYYEIRILIFFLSDSTLSQAQEIMLLCCAWNCRFTPINPHKK